MKYPLRTLTPENANSPGRNNRTGQERDRAAVKKTIGRD